jgi:hypothetical protein
MQWIGGQHPGSFERVLQLAVERLEELGIDVHLSPGQADRPFSRRRRLARGHQLCHRPVAPGGHHRPAPLHGVSEDVLARQVFGAALEDQSARGGLVWRDTRVALTTD